MTDTSGLGVAYLLDHFPVSSQTFVAQEIEGLRARGHLVTVISQRPTGKGAVRADLSLQNQWPFLALAHLIEFWRSPVNYARYLRFVISWPARDMPWLLFSPLVSRHLRRVGIARLHTHFALRSAVMAQAVAILHPVRRSVTTHAYDIFVETDRLERRLAGADVYTISRFNQRYLAELGIDVTAVVACGVIDPGEHPPSQPGWDILSVGRLVPKKGFPTLIRALAVLHRRGVDFDAAIIGDGPLAGDLVGLISDCGLESKVTMAGARDHASVLDEIARAKLFCLACEKAPDGDIDGIPVVLLEAMVRSLPVIACDVSGIPELVDGEVGWLVPSQDVGALADALEHALTSHRAASMRGRAGRHRVLTSRLLVNQVDAMENLLFNVNPEA